MLATGAEPYVPDEFDYGKNPNVVTSLELDGMMEKVTREERFAIISCVGSRNGVSGCSGSAARR